MKLNIKVIAAEGGFFLTVRKSRLGNKGDIPGRACQYVAEGAHKASELITDELIDMERAYSKGLAGQSDWSES